MTKLWMVPFSVAMALAACDGNVGLLRGGDGGAGLDGGPVPDAGPPAASHVDADRFCPSLADLVCGVNDACCGGVVAGEEEETCDEQQLAACEATVGALIDDPRTGYDPEAAGAYLEQLAAQSEGCFSQEPPELADLLGIFRGTGEQGADCTPASDADADVRLAELSCADGLSCELTLRSDRSVRGECLPADPEGCSHPYACAPGRWCDLPSGWTPGHGYGDCKPLKTDAWGCSRDAQCESQFCHPVSRTCAQPVEDRYCAARTYRTNVLADGPIAYWRLGDADGSVAASAVGEALEGVYLGSPGLAEGALQLDDDGAMSLDGVDDAVELPELESLFSDTALSLELWFRRQADSSTGPLLEFQREQEGPGAHLWNHNEPDRVQTNIVGVGGASHVVRSPAATVEADTWYHVVGTYDGSVVRLYVNGEQVGEPNTATFRPRVEGVLRIGLRVDDERRLTGAIDEVAVYDRALTRSQIRQHHARGTEGPRAKRFPLFVWLD